MKKLTRKLFISVLVAVFAFVALGTSTYAWITISTTAEVKAFEAKVDAGEAGIELSETGNDGTWTSELALSASDVKLDDLTTKDGKTFYNLVANGNVMSLEGTPAATGFITKTFYIRKSPNSNGTINVVVNGSAVEFKPVGDSITATGVYNDVTAENLYASNAARFSLAFGAEGTDVKAVYQQAAETKSTKDEWEYNGNTLDYSADGFAHKYAESQQITLPTERELPTTLAAGTDSGIVITLAESTPVKVTLRIWIEGWDNECHEKVLKQTFNVAFGFKVQ